MLLLALAGSVMAQTKTPCSLVTSDDATSIFRREAGRSGRSRVVCSYRSKSQQMKLTEVNYYVVGLSAVNRCWITGATRLRKPIYVDQKTP